MSAGEMVHIIARTADGEWIVEGHPLEIGDAPLLLAHMPTGMLFPPYADHLQRVIDQAYGRHVPIIFLPPDWKFEPGDRDNLRRLGLFHVSGELVAAARDVLEHAPCSDPDCCTVAKENARARQRLKDALDG